MSEIKLSEAQGKALKAAEDWYRAWRKKPFSVPQVFRIFGFAGTGKSSVANQFQNFVKGQVLFATFTGKAALVLQKKGTPASTIHSLIYSVIVDKKTGEMHFEINPASALGAASLLVVDEVSMVNEDLGKDLLSFGVPVVVLGDPEQLPPPNGAGYFTENCKPDIMLTEIHRQAADNPILRLATMARRGDPIPLGSYGDSLVTNKVDVNAWTSADQIICGKNITRTNLTNAYRRNLGYTDSIYPLVGERIIGLKNEKNNTGMLNGEMMRVETEIEHSGAYLKYQVSSLDREGASFWCRTHKFHYNEEMGKPDWKLLSGTQETYFGYVITAHKSQGSQWDDVFILDESGVFREMASRWLYTAITRAAEKLTLVRR